MRDPIDDFLSQDLDTKLKDLQSKQDEVQKKMVADKDMETAETYAERKIKEYREGEGQNIADQPGADGSTVYAEDIFNQKRNEFFQEGKAKIDEQIGLGNKAQEIRQEFELTELQKKRQDRLKGIDTKQNLLRERLLSESSEAEKQVDLQLSKLLEETGISANVIRAQTGEQLAGRGLSRSTLGQSALEDVTQKELQEKGNLRFDAATQQEKIGEARRQSIDRLDQIKEQRTADIDASREEQILGEMHSTAKDAIERHFREADVGRRIDSAFQNSRNNMVGGLVGGITKIFSGFF